MSFISHISTKTGDYSVSQLEMLNYLEKHYQDDFGARKYKALMRDKSIETKHSVLPDFQPDAKVFKLFKEYYQPTTEERMAVYKNEALKLSALVCEKTILNAKINISEITHIIAISCTGMYAPGLEIDLMSALNLNQNTQRHAINFMGCYAAFHGFRLADMICKTNENAKVLMVTVELCSLHFNNKTNDDNLLSTYLFSDGAAACLVSTQKQVGPAFEIFDYHSVLIPEGKKDMAWELTAHGFEMVLSREVPKHIESKIDEAANLFFTKNNLKTDEIKHFAIHPGGNSILKAFENGLGINNEQLKNSYEVLKTCGNMSSSTVLFVLEKYLENPDEGWVYSAAFGPGLSIENALLKLTK